MTNNNPYSLVQVSANNSFYGDGGNNNMSGLGNAYYHHRVQSFDNNHHANDGVAANH